MKPGKALLWAIAAGLPLCAATFWHGSDVVSPNSAVAQTTAPSPSAAPTSDAAIPNRRMFMEYLRWSAFAPQERILQRQREVEVWENFKTFLEHNSPNRYLLMQRQDLQPGSLSRIRLLQRWLNIQSQQTEPALYQVLIDEYQAEDRMIGLAAQLRQAKRRNESDRQVELKQQIRNEAALLVEFNLKQRQIRIQDAQKLLAQEQSDLQIDTHNKDQLADDRASQILSQTDRDFRPPAEDNSAPNLGNP